MPSSDAEEEKVVDNEESSSSTTATVRSTQDEGAIMLPASSRLRMHRSAVRPFFCCGSELSLVSINEQQELRPFDQPRLRGLSGTEDSAESAADIQSENFCENGKAQRERILRKKYLDGFPRKMSMKSMAVKLRGKLPKRLKNVDEHGNIAGTSSGIEGECTGTAYRQTDEQTGFYSVSAASACAESECPKPSVSVPTYHAPDFSKSKAKVTKGKRRGKSKLSGGHSSSSSGGTSANSLLRDWVGDNAADKTGVRQSQGCSNGGPCSGSHKLIGSASVGALFSPAFQKQCAISNPWPPAQSSRPRSGRVDSDEAEAEDSAEEEGQYSDVPSLGSRAPYVSVHSQVDYLHCLVPRLASIANCSFYWGVMDRYEAEKLLENKPEGTFLLRDSAQDEFLFSVSFRRYGRSLHARVEQYNHKFSFDSHDPGVFADDTVCGLIEHYKDPSCCMFFEPMLTLPLNRSYPFSLLHLSRSAVVSCPNLTYDGISNLRVPKSLHSYLRYYHYKHKVRVRNMEGAAASK